MWGITWGSVIDQSAKWEAIFVFIFTPGLEVFRFLIVSLIQILLCCFSSLVFKLVIKEAIISYRHTNQIPHLKNYNFTRTI